MTNNFIENGATSGSNMEISQFAAVLHAEMEVALQSRKNHIVE